MVEEGQLVSDLGYFFEKNNESFYEFHVDNHEIFKNACSRLPYGSHLSIRMPPGTKSLMILGQDECIFKQYIYSQMECGFCPTEQGSLFQRMRDME